MDEQTGHRCRFSGLDEMWVFPLEAPWRDSGLQGQVLLLAGFIVLHLMREKLLSHIKLTSLTYSDWFLERFFLFYSWEKNK